MSRTVLRTAAAFWSNRRAATSIEMAMFFAVAAIAITFALTPLISDSGDKIARNSSDGIDRTVTGSINNGSTNRYVVRRSVLQPSKTSQCVIYPNGTQSGDC
ncbi:MAG: hypothetical protein AAF468_21160 [Pseudomonadota bacterium]